jgi:Protein of unknown function (DUF433)
VSKEEKIDWSECPLVEIKPGVQSGAPVLRGTRMPVSAIVDNFDKNPAKIRWLRCMIYLKASEAQNGNPVEER